MTVAYEYKEEIENHIICAPVHVYDEVFDELDEVYAKAKAYDEHTCDEPIDVNINITLTKQSIEDLDYKDFEHTVKAKLNNKGGLL